VVAVGVKDPYTCAKLGMTLIFLKHFIFLSLSFFSVHLCQTLNLAERQTYRYVYRGIWQLYLYGMEDWKTSELKRVEYI
jgi:hypothetical protein